MYVLLLQRGLSHQLARQVAEELTAKDVVRAHARDELGIDIDELANPLQVGDCRRIATACLAVETWERAPALAGSVCVLHASGPRNCAVRYPA